MPARWISSLRAGAQIAAILVRSLLVRRRPLAPAPPVSEAPEVVAEEPDGDPRRVAGTRR